MTRRVAIIFATAAAIAVTGAAYLSARTSVAALEARTTAKVSAVLEADDDWITLTADGTVLRLSGTAPDSSAQVAALARIGRVMGGIQIRDETNVSSDAPLAQEQLAALSAPDLRLEVLREADALTVFGRLTPDARDGGGVMTRLEAISDQPLVDLTSTIPATARDGRALPRPEGWSDVTEFALQAVGMLERGRVIVTPRSVNISAQLPNAQDSRKLQKELAGLKPEGVALTLDLGTPREVISPFVFEAALENGELLTRECTVETEADAARVADAALALNHLAPGCRIGLGAPSPDWTKAIATGLDALHGVGEGRLSIVDADIALTGPQGYDPEEFSALVENLMTALPEGFVLSAALPPPPEMNISEDSASPPRFTAVRTEDGAVRIRGDVPDVQLGETAKTFAEAKFGFDAVVNETRPRKDLPQGWATHVVGGLEALGLLNRGQLEITEQGLTLTGTAPSLEVRDDVQAVLNARLTTEIDIALDVWEEERLIVENPLQIPAELCAEQIDLVLAADTINFPPGETEIDEASLPIIDRIAEILVACPGARFEIGGHTDSQGRETSNMALSQARADAVLSALLERQIDTVFLYARGYGETQPIADNGTEEGRARNRRIAFQSLDTPAHDAHGLHGEGPELQAGIEGDSGIDAARLESPTTVVVPAGTDPATVMTPAGTEDQADTPAPEEEAEIAAAEDDGASPPTPQEADPAAPEGAEAPEDPSEEDAQGALTSDAQDGDIPRPLPRPDGLGEGN